MAVDPDIAYVASCALGFAFSEDARDEAARRLCRAAGGSAEVLRGALEVLPASPAGDPSLVGAASALLDDAIRQIERPREQKP